MTHCNRCDVDVATVAAITSAGVRQVCPRCEVSLGEVVSLDAEPVKAEAPKASPMPAAPAVRIAVTGDSATTVVEQVRARIASIDVELERAATLKAERRTLAAMLKAAEKKR